jgi:dTDP-4-amino-4,6-dideoxygalactose transaminase
MAAILAEVGPGDEVIMPSFTFPSTANAFVLRGATPVFVDIRPDTLNIDQDLIADAITPRTRAIVVVHYAGICAQMDEIRSIADRDGLIVIEDAAQALLSTYRGRPAGSLGAMACFSFHETKNVVSGEGGAIVINDARLVERADVIREKGTNRVAFRNGTIDKYTWIDVGSSYLPAEIVAAMLWAQLESAESITSARLDLWARYHQVLARFEHDGRLRRPTVPPECGNNGHLYYVLLRDRADRDAMIARLGADGILAPFHYVPLHSSPAGQRYGRSHGQLAVTTSVSERLVRLPLYVGLEKEQAFVIDRITSFLES